MNRPDEFPCPGPERLEPLVVGAAPSTERSLLRAHIATCSDCRTRVREIERNLEFAASIRSARSAAAGTESEAPPDHEPPPARMGPYEILGELGRGGMGVVYEALDPRLRRRIALKVLPDSLARDARLLKLFRREARVLASLDHPNIATIHALEKKDGRVFITMEHVEGTTLSARIRERPFPLDEALAVCRQIALGVEAAHRSGIVHRDLKPQNVVVGPDGRVRILDFGVAQVSRPQAGVRDRRGTASAGCRPGTPGYMSPEILRGDPADHRADIWAFGCLLFACLKGRPAFPGRTARERMAASVAGGLDATRIPKETPAPIVQLLRDCLARSPDDRPSSMALVRRVLEEVMAQRELPGTGVTGGDAAPNNLPHPLSSFVGRGRLISRVHARVLSGRLVTLTGPGGCGKSRLAIEVSRRSLTDFPGGCWFADLSPLGSRSRVAETLATVLGVKKETEPLARTIARRAARGRVLLVIDNCEHILAEVTPCLGELLEAGPDLHIFCTSRESIGWPGEIVIPVPPLDVPAEHERRDVRNVESMRLFRERARSVAPGFDFDEANIAAVTAICRRLDGLPLALELAAARVRTMSAPEINARLDDRFRLLARAEAAGPARHQTLKALIDWSWDYLTPKERRLFARTSVFSGGWTLVALEEVAAVDGISGWEVVDLLTALLDKSLVVRDLHPGAGPARFRMLETVRHYALDRLGESGEERAARYRHAAYFADLAASAEPELTGPGQTEWLRTLNHEHDNLGTALDVLATVPESRVRALIMAGALGRYWGIRGHWAEGRERLESLLQDPACAGRTVERARALNWAGNLAQYRGEYDAAVRHHRECLAVAEEIGEIWWAASACNNLGIVAGYRADYESARTFHERSLSLRRQLGDDWAVGLSLYHLGRLEYLAGDIGRGRALLEEAVSRAAAAGDRIVASTVLITLGEVAQAQGDIDRGRAVIEEALPLLRDAGESWATASALARLGSLAVDGRDFQSARRCLRESLSLVSDLGDVRLCATVIAEVGLLMEAVGNKVEAIRLLNASEALRDEVQAPQSPRARRRFRAASERLGSRCPIDIPGRAGDFEAAVLMALEVL